MVKFKRHLTLQSFEELHLSPRLKGVDKVTVTPIQTANCCLYQNTEF